MSSTIAAISTAMGESGIGIVRLSGKNSIEIANSIFKSIDGKEFKIKDNRKLNYGHIIDEEENVVDEVLIAMMKEPKTYTRENMVEIYCHGGIVPVQKILELTLKNGALLAEPGEFTKRAFLNGRLDLSQAEAVIDLIKAKTNKSYEMSLNQLEGKLSKKINELRNTLLEMIANIEANIDFPEDDLETFEYIELEKKGRYIKEEIVKLIDTTDRGKILRDGLNTVILGKPNVGKSSLLNAILRENRAIVTDIPGTTRDIIEEYINIDGIPLKIVDTAGIRMTEDLVEKIGVDRAKEMVEEADLLIGVFDTSEKLTEDDYEIIEILNKNKSIILLNKTDLDKKWEEEEIERLLPNKKIITAAILKGAGLDKLETEIKNMFYKGDINIKSDILINNLRHKDQLLKSLDNIEEGLKGIQGNIPLDCIEVDIKNCWENLGEISGDTIGEDILDKIFSEFCIGK